MPTDAQMIEAHEVSAETFDASDPVQVKEAKKKTARKNRGHNETIAEIMQYERGRAWIFDLIERYNPLSDPIVQGDPYLTYSNIGMQNVTKRLAEEVMAAAPQEYLKMMKEAREK